MYLIYKVIDKKVRQIAVCPETRIISDELVSGETLKKLEQADKVFEIDHVIIVERFFRFKEIMDNLSGSRYFTPREVRNDLRINELSPDTHFKPALQHG